MLLICCEHIRTLSNPVREEVPLKLMWKTSPDTFCRKLVYDSNVSYIVFFLFMLHLQRIKRELCIGLRAFIGTQYLSTTTKPFAS